MKRFASQSQMKEQHKRVLDDDDEANGGIVLDERGSPRKPREEEPSLSAEKHCKWRSTQAGRLKKQLKAVESMRRLVADHVLRYRAHYSPAPALTPIKISDLADLLFPQWAPAHEQAAVFWMGEWRPTSILNLVSSLAQSFDDPIQAHKTLAQLAHQVRIEEAVIDEEMTEIQANCVFHLPFGTTKDDGSGSGLRRIGSEFNKIRRVVVKAQKLRAKTMEMVAKKVLTTQTDAAKFFVNFAEIQHALHALSVKRRSRVLIDEIEQCI